MLGPGGRGSLELHGLGPDDVPVLVGTLGKALGTFGAFVAALPMVIDAAEYRSTESRVSPSAAVDRDDCVAAAR